MRHGEVGAESALQMYRILKMPHQISSGQGWQADPRRGLAQNTRTKVRWASSPSIMVAHLLLPVVGLLAASLIGGDVEQYRQEKYFCL